MTDWQETLLKCGLEPKAPTGNKDLASRAASRDGGCAAQPICVYQVLLGCSGWGPQVSLFVTVCSWRFLAVLVGSVSTHAGCSTPIILAPMISGAIEFLLLLLP